MLQVGDDLNADGLSSLWSFSGFLIRRSCILSSVGEGVSDGPSPPSPLSKCIEGLSSSSSYKKTVAIKKGLARIHVLTIAKHLIISLINVKDDLKSLKDPPRGKRDAETLTIMLGRHMESLNVFTSMPALMKGDLTDVDRSYLSSVPVPFRVCQYFAEIPFLSRCYAEFTRTIFKLLGESCMICPPSIHPIVELSFDTFVSACVSPLQSRVIMYCERSSWNMQPWVGISSPVMSSVMIWRQ